MQVETAITLINESIYTVPGVEMKAEDYRHRFEDAICLSVNLTEARRSERELAPHYPETVPGGARSKYVIQVGSIDDVAELVGRVLDSLLDTYSHELREFTRVRPTNWAPFHPHKEDGIKRWSARVKHSTERDLKFGIV